MDQPNNLRPYYNPGTFNSPIKLRQPSFSNYTSISAPSNLTIVNGSKNLNSVAAAASSVSAPDFDLDFGTTGDTVTEIGRSMMRLYGKIFFSQPFRVGRLLLQVGDWSEIEYPGEPHLHHHGRVDEIHNNDDGNSEHEASDDSDYHDLAHQRRYYERSSSSLSFRGLGRKEIQEMGINEEEDDDDGEESYFTNVDNIHAFGQSSSSSSHHPRANNSTQANIKRTLNKQKRSNKKKAASTETEKQNDPYINRIQPESIKFVDIIGALQAQDGLKGLWRGVNTTFIMDAMQLTLEAWLSGFFSSISGVPDPHFLDISHSTTPGASLVTAVTASVVTAVLLSPLSIIRTRMITTTFETKPRSVRTSLRNLDSFFIPNEVFLPTVLYSGATSVLSKSTSFILQQIFGIDSSTSPALYSIFTLLLRVLQVGVKLPLETLVRRSHLSYLKLAKYSLLVRPAEYDGVFGTVWNVLNGRYGVETLYRGWRVSMLGVVSEWGVENLDRSDRGKELF
ncbi:hypothetical protein D0Z00_001460 [Geotrichum galactomycetum]|uniref:Uncharacterized protein n=1 Tax=Geotrichum galactomycetum TaxID=27317 RepID=A0ACB6V6Y6_9ASCO|nr:hypothetical protein D0Z00_001460 [Geotrichum candidum]